MLIRWKPFHCVTTVPLGLPDTPYLSKIPPFLRASTPHFQIGLLCNQLCVPLKIRWPWPQTVIVDRDVKHCLCSYLTMWTSLCPTLVITVLPLPSSMYCIWLCLQRSNLIFIFCNNYFFLPTANSCESGIGALCRYNTCIFEKLPY